MLGVGLYHDQYQDGDERVGALFFLQVPDQACEHKALSVDDEGRARSEQADGRTEYDLAAVQYADELIPWCFVVVDFQEF